MAASKSRFALAAVTALATCAAALLTFLSGSLPLQAINIALPFVKELTGLTIPTAIGESPGIISIAAALLCTTLAMLLIYRFAVTTIKHWEGPITVTVNELAKLEQDRNLGLLAFTEAQRLLLRKRDPVASDVAVNWEQKQSEAPPSPAWHLLARDLFLTAFAEAEIPESGWRDMIQAWDRPHLHRPFRR